MTTISAYCVINNVGKILLTSDVDQYGWKLPGGKVEEGELIQDAVIREVKEKTNLQIEITDFLNFHEYLSKNNEHRLRLYFIGELRQGELKVKNYLN